MRANIAVLPGDGIGPKVTQEAVGVDPALLDSNTSLTYNDVNPA